MTRQMDGFQPPNIGLEVAGHPQSINQNVGGPNSTSEQANSGNALSSNTTQGNAEGTQAITHQ